MLTIENDHRCGPASVVIRKDGYVRFSARAARLLPARQVIFTVSGDRNIVAVRQAQPGERAFTVNKRGVTQSKGLALTTGADGRYAIRKDAGGVVVIDLTKVVEES